MKVPRISIVTPCLNSARYIREAIESVLAQGYADVEHIVVDGMSTDKTLELLASYPHLRVIREPDEGLYDALNKGLKIATGEVIGHLNSDDSYPAGTFTAVAAAFNDPGIEAAYGGAEIVEDGRVVRQFTSREEIDLSVRSATFGVPITNARFFRRSVYERVGYNNASYRIAADRDFLLRVAIASPRAALLDRIVYRYRMHEGSLTFNRDEARAAKMRDEFLAIAEDHLSRADLPADARCWCVRWHERESAHAAARAVFAGGWARAVDYARRGLRVRKSWPVMFARHVAGIAFGSR